MNLEDLLRLEILYVDCEKSKKFCDQNSECYYSIFRFKNNQVFLNNVYLFDIHNGYKAEYQEITDFFLMFKESYKLIELCELVIDSLKRYGRECEFTYELIPLIATIKEDFKPKLQYEIKKHNGRHLKFITGNRKAHNRWWNYLLCEAVRKGQKSSRFKRDEEKYFPNHENFKIVRNRG